MGAAYEGTLPSLVVCRIGVLTMKSQQRLRHDHEQSRSFRAEVDGKQFVLDLHEAASASRARGLGCLHHWDVDRWLWG